MPPAASRRYFAPDGGWGWVVVFGSFVLQALSFGSTYTFGVLFQELLEIFEAKESITAWVGSIQIALLFFTGLFAGPLVSSYGCRPVAVAGCMLSAIGFMTSATVNSVYILYFAYGILTGIGNGLTYMASCIVTQYYFDTRRSLATGLSVSGCGVGILLFGYLTNLLLHLIKWRWTLVVEGGMLLSGVAFAALFRPLPPAVVAPSADERRPLLNPVAECPPNSDANPMVEKNRCCPNWIRSIFNFSMFQCVPFVLLCVATMGFCLSNYASLTYVPTRAVQMIHAGKGNAARLVSIIGVTNIFSRMLFGWLGNCGGPTVRLYMSGTTLALCGVQSVCIQFFDTYSMMIVYSVLFGLLTGCWTSVIAVIVVDMMGIEHVSKALSQKIATISIPLLVSAPLAGWLVEVNGGDYNLPFIVFGTAQLLGAVACFLTRCFRWPTAAQRDRITRTNPTTTDQTNTSGVSEEQLVNDLQNLENTSTSDGKILANEKFDNEDLATVRVIRSTSTEGRLHQT